MSLPLVSTKLAFLDGLERSHFNYSWSGIAVSALFVTSVVILTKTQSGPSYDAIPAIGDTGFFSSHLSAWKAVKHAHEMITESYDKYKFPIFRFPEIARWHVLVADAKLIEEMCRAPDDVLSFAEATRDNLALDYVFGRDVVSNQYHLSVIRAQLTRSLGSLLADVHDEIVQAFEDNIPATDEWTKVKVAGTVTQIVARTTNRVFVGLPKCRDPEYTDLTIKFTKYAAIGGMIIRLFPDVLKPIAKIMFTNIPKAFRTGLKHLTPMIEERQKKIDEYGSDYPGKPNDLLSWLMDEAKGGERTPGNLTRRLLLINFAAIHSSSTVRAFSHAEKSRPHFAPFKSFTHALYTLALYPQYIAPLRAEIEDAIAKEGWSKVSVARMHKLDSFLKETQRVYGLSMASMHRKAMRPYTFSDGTHIPEGTMVSASAMGHLDEQVYPHANEFHGFRFSDKREEGEEDAKNQLVATSADYLVFGHGRHACPGRFFVANELKMMMAHLVLTYDMKLENEGVRPADQWIGIQRIPNRNAELLFRKRKD